MTSERPDCCRGCARNFQVIGLKGKLEFQTTNGRNMATGVIKLTVKAALQDSSNIFPKPLTAT